MVAVFGAFGMGMTATSAQWRHIQKKRGSTDGLPSVSISEVEHFIHVPLMRQDTDYTCGVAALRSILYFYDSADDYSESYLAEELESDPEIGTTIAKIEKFSKSIGYTVQKRSNMTIDDLKALIRDGKPVIVLLQAWRSEPGSWEENWSDGHYAVANGYDEQNIYFMDPSTAGTYTFIPISEFMERWHDVDGEDTRYHQFGMIISKSRPVFNRDIAIHME
jgi:predicted double-glycine peptidase